MQPQKQHLPPLHLIIPPCANPLPVGGKREREKRKNLGMEKHPDLPSLRGKKSNCMGKESVAQKGDFFFF